jgi:hypothetical protein
MLIFPKFHFLFLLDQLGVFVEIKIKISRNFNIAKKKEKKGKSIQKKKKILKHDNGGEYVMTLSCV